MSLRLRLVLAALAGLFVSAAGAHQASDAYLAAAADADGRLRLTAEVALRDLDVELDLDADADGRLTWGELRGRQGEIAAHVAARLRVDEGRCTLEPAAFSLDRKADATYAVLRYRGSCDAAAVPMLSYGLFRDADPTHRGLLRRADGSVLALAAGDPPVPLDAAGAGAGAGTRGTGFFANGLHHILIGADHVLFLVCLMLPLALGREGMAAPRGRALWGPLLGLVTAFTLAHSITLALAAWRLVAVPPSVIEPLIAATIALAALDNLWPLLGQRRVAAAFAFGLVHGFGFAGPLLEIDLPPGPMAWALLQFNLGVEAGQLAVVALALGVLWPLRRRATPARWALRSGSVAVAVLALVWVGERLLDVKLLPI